MRSHRIAIVATLAVAWVVGAASAQDAVEDVKKKLEVVKHYVSLSCPSKARAALAAAEKAAAGLGEFEKEKVQDDLKSAKEDVERIGKDRNADEIAHGVDSMFESLDAAVEDAKRSPDEERRGYDETLQNIRELLADEDNVPLLGKERCDKYGRKLAWIVGEMTKAKLGAWVEKVEKLRDQIQEVLDGKNKDVYADTVEKWFAWAGETLGKCPADDARVKKLKADVKRQRATFDKQQEEAAKAEIIDPAVKYWASIKESYLKEAEGWEKETKPTSLRDWTHNAPPSLGCPKTEKLLSEVVSRWFDNDNVKTALEKFPTSEALKPALDEASKWREEAGNKACAFVNAILDEALKLPKGQDRDDAQGLLGEMERILSQDAKGSTACEKTLLRIKAVDKRWTDEKEKGEADRVALEKKLGDACNAAWPELSAALVAKAKKLDAPAALSDIDAWKGTVVHFKGGAKGVNLNRSGWNYMDQYDFIVEKDGVPVCGNYDEGLSDALKAFTTTTGMEPLNCEECIGIVDGTCKVSERVQNPLDRERYMRGRQLDGVRIRIVAWKACVVSVACGNGTSLKKTDFKEVDAPEKGRTR